MSIESEVELKSLKTRYLKLETEIIQLTDSFNETKREFDSELIYKRGKLRELSLAIANLTAPDKPLIVTEHALLRYFERVLEYNLEDIKNKIITDKVKEQYKLVGNGTFPIDGMKQQFNGNNWSVVIKNNTAITIE